MISLTAGAAAVGTAAGVALAAPATAAPTPSTGSSAATKSVIVVLRDQVTSLPANRTHVNSRRAKVTKDQNAVLGSVRGTKAKVHHYTSLNAVSLKVDPTQAAQLASNPAVAAVLPDTKISVPAAQPKVVNSGAKPHAVAAPPAGACPTDPAKPILEPEALSDTHTASDDPNAKTAQQLANGAGTKVAYIADAINPDIPDLIRADGTHVITDYKAFSADGPTPNDGGAEAFGDASSIAAQGRVSYDLSQFVNSNYALPKGCNIRVLGMAPGASIVALKTDFYTSSIIQAIDYAVSVAHVDVLNESFGGNGTPDTSAKNAIQAFNDMAVDAGTTVTASSGDAGTTGTIGSPATDPKVISVAASTNNRGYAQTGYAGARTFSNGKWINDEISSLSSGGFTQAGGTVDITAPGESGWALCDKNTTSGECANYNGTNSDVQLFGGTSQSAPLTAGAAALVIQAYRSTHRGNSPSPALVKRFLTSTATDLGLPPYEQGAGLLDSRAAVEAALTYKAKEAAPAGVGSNVLTSTSQVDVSGAPGSHKTVKVGVTNAGTKKVTVATSTRDFTTVGTDTESTTLDANSTQTFPYPTTGAPWVYKKINFTVPAGTDRLAGNMIWQGAARTVGTTSVTPVVRVTLIDPSGAYVANSRPQGGAVSANYANLDVRAPAAGKWTAVLYTVAGASGYSGPVTFRATAQRATAVGTVSPAVTTLKPGQTKNVKVGLTLPASSGDNSQAITIASSGGHTTAVAVVERAVVATKSGSGSFTGTITGGNARAGAPAGTFTYAFDVAKGRKNVNVGIKLATDKRYLLEGVLVSPSGEVAAVDGNRVVDPTTDTISAQSQALQMTAVNPIAGRWRVVILIVNPVPGAALTENFTGTIAFDKINVFSAGVPTSPSTTLARGKATTGTLTVTNNGIAAMNVQVDPRTNKVQNIPLTSPFGSQNLTLPGPSEADFLVPPNTLALTGTSASSYPALIEMTPGTQGIDLVGDLKDGQNGDTISTVTDTPSAGPVSTGLWYLLADQVGAFGPEGAPAGTTHIDLSARTLGFDRAVTSSTGDFYDVVTDPTADIGSAVTINPGETKSITVTITPNAKVGTKVSGVLNVYTPPSFAFPSFNTTGDVLASLPYSYTVGK
ncbi:protease inhibitor I9 family protein [uncultured Jatrophihabitans sp.]|uniref:protease inhibitor I9 family protein n=1 Tax=uncultured Jatrophihabitans sp. TaxID=1610747 RepID=UPI0035CA068F